MASKKSNLSWSSFFLSILLIAAVIAVSWAIYDVAQTLPEQNKTTTITTIKPLSTDNLTLALLDKFYDKNSNNNERLDLLQAIQNTLGHLQNSNNQQTLQTLNKLDLLGATTILNEQVKSEANSREAAKTWVDIGNLQQLQSSQLALYAYRQASKLDDGNINAWNRLGNYYRHQQQYALAEKAYQKVLDMADDSSSTLAVAYANFGLLNQAQAKHEEAEKAYLKALEINTQLKNKQSMASNNENLAISYKNEGKAEEAKQHYLDALSLYQQLGQTDNEASLLTALGSLYHQQRDFEQAKSAYQKALDIQLKSDNHNKVAALYSNLGIITQQQNQPEEAKGLFDKALQLFTQTNNKSGIAEQKGNLGILLRSQKQFVDAESAHKDSLQIYQDIHHISGISQQQLNLGFLYNAWDKPEKACDFWKQSQTTLNKHNDAISARSQRIVDLIDGHCSEPNQQTSSK